MRTATLAISFLLTVTASWQTSAIAGASEAAGKTQIRVRSYDLSNVDEKTLTQAEEIASRLLSSAGVDLAWETGKSAEALQLGSDFSAGKGNVCTVPLRSFTVSAQILPDSPAGFYPQALGYSLPCARFGMQVSIYLDRVKAVSASAGVRSDRVLGYAIAHEVGHVLLRSSEHADGGLMKGVWSNRDWKQAALFIVPFSVAQREQILYKLRRTP